MTYDYVAFIAESTKELIQLLNTLFLKFGIWATAEKLQQMRQLLTSVVESTDFTTNIS